MNTTLGRTRHVPALLEEYRGVVYIVGRADELDSADSIDFGASLAERHIKMLESALRHWNEQKNEMESQGEQVGRKELDNELTQGESKIEVQAGNK